VSRRDGGRFRAGWHTRWICTAELGTRGAQAELLDGPQDGEGRSRSRRNPSVSELWVLGVVRDPKERFRPIAVDKSRSRSELPRYPSLFVAGLATGQITAEYASILLFCFFPKGTHERLRAGCNGGDSWNYFGKKILDSTGMTLRSMENGTEVLPKKLTRREPEGLLLCGSPKHWVAPVYCTGGRRGCRSSRFNFFAG
jgi:hypothetical protein